mgnify:CR=1 FL=1
MRNAFIPLLASLTILACGGGGSSSGSPAPAPQTHVYAAGEVYNSSGYSVATVWKDGTPTALADGTNYSGAYGVFPSGSVV